MCGKVLIIGIDGGTWNILRPAMDEGFMPNLSRLVDSGCSGILESTLPAITPAAWGSFQTGMNPGANGVHDFFQWNKTTKKANLVNSNNLCQTIWETASDHGKHVGVLNVPMTYPPRKISGYMVTGVMTPSLESEFTYPAEFKNELLENVTDYQIINTENSEQRFGEDQFESQVAKMGEMIDYRCRAAKFMLAKDSSDLFMVHFHASDIIQHGAWGYMDKDHQLYDQEKCRYLFEHFYRRLDEGIDRVRKAFEVSSGDDFLTLVVSDHGFQANKRQVNLGVWLSQQGYLKVLEQPKKPLLKRLTEGLGVGRLLGKFIPSEKITRMERSILKISQDRYLWDQTRAYCRAGNSEGFIYLTEEDRSMQEHTADELVTRLLELKDPRTNAAVVKKVHRKHEVFHGGKIAIMPDLVVEPVDGYSFMGTYHEDAELFHDVNIDSDTHLGKHAREGVIVAAGPGIVHRDWIRLQITDIVPTILYYMQVPIGTGYDGTVAREIFTEDFFRSNEIKTDSSEGAKQRSKDKEHLYSQQEQEEISKRLKDLGYL